MMCHWEPGNPRRKFLVQMLVQCRVSGSMPAGWEISQVDEALLFEFISPSMATRDRGFRLCNLPVEWGAELSALVMPDGQRRRFDLRRFVDFGPASLTTIQQILPTIDTARRTSETTQAAFNRLVSERAKPMVRKAQIRFVEKHL